MGAVVGFIAYGFVTMLVGYYAVGDSGFERGATIDLVAPLVWPVGLLLSAFAGAKLGARVARATRPSKPDAKKT